VVSSCDGRALGTLGVSSFDGRCLAHVGNLVFRRSVLGTRKSRCRSGGSRWLVTKWTQNGGARGDESHLITTWRGSPRESPGSRRMRQAQRQSEVKVLSVCL
jgi:hypothetical protein